MGWQLWSPGMYKFEIAPFKILSQLLRDFERFDLSMGNDDLLMRPLQLVYLKESLSQ